VIIELSKDDVETATRCGEARQSHNESRISDQKVCDQDSLEININGAKAELAVVKATGYEWNCFSEEFWKTPKDKRPADVGPIEVRTNNRRYSVNLLLFQKDGSDMRPHLLVIPYSATKYLLAGWRFGFECRNDEFLKEEWKRPCYAVPDGNVYLLLSLENWCISHGYNKWQITTQRNTT